MLNKIIWKLLFSLLNKETNLTEPDGSITGYCLEFFLLFRSDLNIITVYPKRQTKVNLLNVMFTVRSIYCKFITIMLPLTPMGFYFLILPKELLKSESNIRLIHWGRSCNCFNQINRLH